MGILNFVERCREYATLKVLGYHQKEIRKLILHENAIIAVLGVLSGIYPGILLTDVILHSCEPETGFLPGQPGALLHHHRLCGDLLLLRVPAAPAYAQKCARSIWSKRSNPLNNATHHAQKGTSP